MDRHLKPLLRLVVAGALSMSVVGVANAASDAKVRVLHASPDAPAVDVYLDDAKVDALTNVPFGAISSYLDVPAGNHNVKVYATGDTTSPVIDANVSLAAGGMYTVAATNAVASIEAQVSSTSRRRPATRPRFGSSISARMLRPSTSPRRARTPPTRR